MNSKVKRFLSFVLSLVLVLIDQYSKYLVIENIPEGQIGFEFWGDFLYICHVRNTGIAFSMGADFGNVLRFVLFLVLPICAMAVVIYLIISEKSKLTQIQRWFAAGILGGGIGTLIDRVFRFKTGVVDFISVKFYGLFGMDRWPTFNISDSCVVVFVILLAITVLFPKDSKEEEDA